MFTIQNGRLQRDGQPFFSVGFNYHPSPTGCQYWQKWDAVRIDEDLQKMAQLGFNTVRFFVFWADFEPAPGQYDPEKVARLKEFVTLAQRYQMQCVPALLTIWMNGQLFDLPWRQGRNLWTDQEMVAREIAYLQHIASALRGADNILAYDLGDEVMHVDFALAQSLPRTAVTEWLQALADGIRQAHPGAFVLQANEASAITGAHQFRPENSQALDLLALHGFPVWSPFAIESIASYKASCFVPFLVKYGRMDGPVLVDELGSYGGDEKTSKNYLRATTHSALANGACGTIVWCWQDFTTKAKPYALRPGERFVGLVDKQGYLKPALTPFQTFAQSATTSWADLTIPPAPIGVYVPECHHEGNASYLQSNASTAPAAFYAYLLLKRAHLPFEFTRGPLQHYQLVICPSVHHITLPEQERLMDYVAHGGVVYYSTADYLQGFGGEDLFGVLLKDFTLQAEEMAGFRWQGQEYPIQWTSYEKETSQIPIVRATTAEVLATYPNGTPAFTRHVYGQGTAYYLNAPLEHQLNLPRRLTVAPWQLLYVHIAQAAGVQRELDIDAPEVELAVMSNHRCRFAFIINHAPEPIQATLYRYLAQGEPPLSEKIRLEGKGVQTITWNVDGR
jgi:hypothetical protein